MAAEMEAEIPAGGHIQQGPSPVEVHAQPCKLAAVEMAQAANAASAWYQPCAVRTACVAGPACCTCLQQGDHMIACDTCAAFYHPGCIGLYPGYCPATCKPGVSTSWQCPACSCSQCGQLCPPEAASALHSLAVSRRQTTSSTISSATAVITAAVGNKDNSYARSVWQGLLGSLTSMMGDIKDSGMSATPQAAHVSPELVTEAQKIAAAASSPVAAQHALETLLPSPGSMSPRNDIPLHGLYHALIPQPCWLGRRSAVWTLARHLYHVAHPAAQPAAALEAAPVKAWCQQDKAAESARAAAPETARCTGPDFVRGSKTEEALGGPAARDALQPANTQAPHDPSQPAAPARYAGPRRHVPPEVRRMWAEHKARVTAGLVEFETDDEDLQVRTPRQVSPAPSGNVTVTPQPPLQPCLSGSAATNLTDGVRCLITLPGLQRQGACKPGQLQLHPAAPPSITCACCARPRHLGCLSPEELATVTMDASYGGPADQCSPSVCINASTSAATPPSTGAHVGNGDVFSPSAPTHSTVHNASLAPGRLWLCSQGCATIQQRLSQLCAEGLWGVQMPGSEPEESAVGLQSRPSLSGPYWHLLQLTPHAQQSTSVQVPAGMDSNDIAQAIEELIMTSASLRECNPALKVSNGAGEKGASSQAAGQGPAGSSEQCKPSVQLQRMHALAALSYIAAGRSAPASRPRDSSAGSTCSSSSTTGNVDNISTAQPEAQAQLLPENRSQCQAPIYAGIFWHASRLQGLILFQVHGSATAQVLLLAANPGLGKPAVGSLATTGGSQIDACSMLCSLSVMLQTIQVNRLLVHASCLTQQQQSAAESEGPKGMTIRLKPPTKLARKMQAAQASAALQTACTLPAVEVLQSAELGFMPVTPWVLWELSTFGLLRDLHCAAKTVSTAIMFKQLVPGPPPALPPMPPTEPTSAGAAAAAAQHASPQPAIDGLVPGKPAGHDMAAGATAEDDMEIDAAEKQHQQHQAAEAAAPAAAVAAGVNPGSSAAVAVAKGVVPQHQEQQQHLPSVVDLLEEADEEGGHMRSQESAQQADAPKPTSSTPTRTHSRSRSRSRSPSPQPAPASRPRPPAASVGLCPQLRTGASANASAQKPAQMPARQQQGRPPATRPASAHPQQQQQVQQQGVATGRPAVQAAHGGAATAGQWRGAPPAAAAAGAANAGGNARQPGSANPGAVPQPGYRQAAAAPLAAKAQAPHAPPGQRHVNSTGSAGAAAVGSARAGISQTAAVPGAGAQRPGMTATRPQAAGTQALPRPDVYNASYPPQQQQQQQQQRPQVPASTYQQQQPSQVQRQAQGQAHHAHPAPHQHQNQGAAHAHARPAPPQQQQQLNQHYQPGSTAQHAGGGRGDRRGRHYEHDEGVGSASDSESYTSSSGSGSYSSSGSGSSRSRSRSHSSGSVSSSRSSSSGGRSHSRSPSHSPSRSRSRSRPPRRGRSGSHRKRGRSSRYRSTSPDDDHHHHHHRSESRYRQYHRGGSRHGSPERDNYHGRSQHNTGTARATGAQRDQYPSNGREGLERAWSNGRGLDIEEGEVRESGGGRSAGANDGPRRRAYDDRDAAAEGHEPKRPRVDTAAREGAWASRQAPAARDAAGADARPPTTRPAAGQGGAAGSRPVTPPIDGMREFLTALQLVAPDIELNANEPLPAELVTLMDAIIIQQMLQQQQEQAGATAAPKPPPGAGAVAAATVASMFGLFSNNGTGAGGAAGAAGSAAAATAAASALGVSTQRRAAAGSLGPMRRLTPVTQPAQAATPAAAAAGGAQAVAAANAATINEQQLMQQLSAHMDAQMLALVASMQQRTTGGAAGTTAGASGVGRGGATRGRGRGLGLGVGLGRGQGHSTFRSSIGAGGEAGNTGYSSRYSTRRDGGEGGNAQQDAGERGTSGYERRSTRGGYQNDNTRSHTGYNSTRGGGGSTRGDHSYNRRRTSDEQEHDGNWQSSRGHQRGSYGGRGASSGRGYGNDRDKNEGGAGGGGGRWHSSRSYEGRGGSNNNNNSSRPSSFTIPSVPVKLLKDS